MSEHNDITQACMKKTFDETVAKIGATREAQLRDAVALNDELLEALKEARENMEDWASYAGDYFRAKHDIAGDLAKLDAIIAKAERAK